MRPLSTAAARNGACKEMAPNSPPGHGACHHTPRPKQALMSPKWRAPIFPIGDVGDIGASNRTCGAGDAGHDASGVEDRDLDPAKLIRLTIGEL
ncbi:hypothetical protein XI25_27835 [Paenibacillus sp. DMB20]|nr:hypothetical protein XI25_27835 [Paenibacillus sp. DMB20]